ncbi:GH12 family glycosyl hydrolase domain-containing protein [Moheibacter sediminis]|uniref:Glycosyl hydrolase family 12 n=1 Tax=Moheibacter sediminis TaxID=1434700 RepID=A0A1W1YEU1_9FLAO|nr:hypothetical protein [Moheibacter sediminis]SMC34675.1 Glycosyl hydrolase family 12 [Moheibacter sediminis]
MKYLFHIFNFTFLISCSTTHIISVENPEFTKLKNQADYKDCSGATKQFENFSLINNKWGVYKIKSGNYTQCIYHKDGIFGWEWDAPSKSYGVLGYPELWLGTSAWGLKSEIKQPNYFKKLDELKTLKAEFDTKITATDKKYNLAFDIWLHSESTVAKENIAVELMVWEDYNKFKSHGKKKETIRTSFGTYDMLYGIMKKPEINSKWIYIAFIRTDKRTTGKINLKELLDFLIQKNYISSDLYISSIEFGTEVLNSKGNIIINKYEVEIE